MGAVRITQLDGKLPNLALMRLAAHHRRRGDDVRFSRSPYRDMLEPEYERVYGSAIFDFTAERVEKLQREFPGCIVSGTWNVEELKRLGREPLTIEALDHSIADALDYSDYPGFEASIGFTQRGCRLKCGFCSVPFMEGKPRSVGTIADLWRGPSYPKHIHLLDNDFFGQPRHEWEARIDELLGGGFKVCLNQGINIRMIDEDAAAALAAIDYRDDEFETRRLYTAWDNIGDEKRFLAGVETLAKHGIPPRHLLVYMLVGYDKRETWERLFYRFEKMVALGIRPYPMVHGNRRKRLPLGGCNQRIEQRTLGEFQRWVIRKAYNFIPFEEYKVSAKGRLETRQHDLFAEVA